MALELRWTKVLESKYGAWRNLDETRRNHKELIWWRDLCFVRGLEEEGGDSMKV